MTSKSPSAWELQAGRFELFSRLADDLAHEIKNPLHAMVINLEVLKRRVVNGDADGALDRVGVLEEELRRVNELVHRLLLLARPSREGVQALDVDEAVSEVVPLLEIQARMARVPFEYRPLGVETRAPIQRDVLAYALVGLAGDAIAAANGAPLTVTAGRDGDDVYLQVAPGGPPPRAAGAGARGVAVLRADAGLAIADQLLRASGARAEWLPAHDGGGVFRISLPQSGGA